MGFFAVLAASLFAVFIFTVFGGYSLLLWCQQSLWMVVPPALVLAVLVWTFLKMDDKITALQKRWMNWKLHKKTRRSLKNNTAPPFAEKTFCKGRALLFVNAFTLVCRWLQIQQDIHPEEVFLGLQMQIAVIFVHYRLGRYQPMPVPRAWWSAGYPAAFSACRRNGSPPQAPAWRD